MAEITGTSGDDFLDGGIDNDEIIGGLGRDIINGGAGDDIIRGDILAGAFLLEPGSLRASYFNIPSSTRNLGQIDFTTPPIHQEFVTEIQQFAGGGSFYDGGPTNDFAALYEGSFQIADAGDYTFFLNSDDGSQLFINGELVVNNDGLHANRLRSETITLEAGFHDIEIRYFERGGQATLDFDWAGPGFGRTQMLFEVPTNPVGSPEIENSDIIQGGDGNDTLFGGDGADFISGGDGDDTIYADEDPTLEPENLLVNGSFEANVISNIFTRVSSTDLIGWQTIAGSNQVDHLSIANITGDSILGVTPTDGNQFIELDSRNELDGIFQDVETENGRSYEIALDVSQRPRQAASTNTVEVYWNDDIVAVIDPSGTTFETFTFEVIGTGGSDRLELREVANDNDFLGAWVDNVSLVLLPETAGIGDILEGGAGNDTIHGSERGDTITGGTGNDLMHGHGGADQFLINSLEFGQDTIFGWEDGLDLIDFGFTGVAFADLSITSAGGSTVISLVSDPSQSITLDGVDAGLVSADDFLFGTTGIPGGLPSMVETSQNNTVNQPEALDDAPLDLVLGLLNGGTSSESVFGSATVGTVDLFDLGGYSVLDVDELDFVNLI
ncbi:MAG: PA14 domain-containing protein [Pseudomonadota bacterium]